MSEKLCTLRKVGGGNGGLMTLQQTATATASTANSTLISNLSGDLIVVVNYTVYGSGTQRPSVDTTSGTLTTLDTVQSSTANNVRVYSLILELKGASSATLKTHNSPPSGTSWIAQTIIVFE